MSSQILQSPADCCTPCPEPLVQNIPGPQGAAGADGANGQNGLDAYTSTTTDFTMPPEAGSVVAEVVSSDWAVIGQIVFVGSGATIGWFQVVAKPDSQHVTLLNLADSGTGAYAENALPGANFPSGSQVSPGGLQGVPGLDGDNGAPVDATYITQTPSADLTNEQPMSAESSGLMTNTFGSGIVTITPLGTADTNVAPVDDAAGLTAGEAVFATAAGIESQDAATARTSLGLGTMATQDANNVAITGGSITGVSIALPAGLPMDLLIYRNQQVSATDAGGITAGVWTPVPINVKTVDTGSNGSIVGNTMHLAAGTYRVNWRCGMLSVGNFQTRLYDLDAGTYILYGSVARSAAAEDSNADSFGEGQFTLAVDHDLQLQAYCSDNRLGDGFGKAAGIGVGEVYQAITFVKETS